jgi:hypothetical protein
LDTISAILRCRGFTWMGSIAVTSEPTLAEIREHLDEVLASPAFRNSQRSSEFLRFVVTHTLEGRHDMLKERQIGEAVFGRRVDYDTGQDSIVRVKANEVRRRLAQYYDLHSDSPVRIDLLPGHYVVHCHRQAAKPLSPAPAAPSSRRRRSLLGAAAASVLTVLLTGWMLWPASLFESFWQPVFESSGQVLISIPHPEVYRIYGPGKHLFIDAFQPRQPGFHPAKLPEPLPALTIHQEPNLYLGIGDARSLAMIYSLLQTRGKQPVIRRAIEAGFTELRSAASVQLGGFTNQWTLELGREMPYVFRANGPDWGIVNSNTGASVCVKPRLGEPPSRQDCAIVARLLDSKSGTPVMIAAGLDHYGTFAVGEFVTQPSLL